MDEIVKLTSDAEYGATWEIREAARKRLEELKEKQTDDPTQAG